MSPIPRFQTSPPWPGPITPSAPPSTSPQELPDHILLPVLQEEKAAYIAEREQAKQRVSTVRNKLVRDFAEREVSRPPRDDPFKPEELGEIGFSPEEMEFEEAERAYWQASEQVDPDPNPNPDFER